jgi:hypothetical protein
MCDLLNQITHVGFYFSIQNLTSVFDRPDDMIIYIVNTCSCMYKIVFFHTHSMTYIAKKSIFIGII